MADMRRAQAKASLFPLMTIGIALATVTSAAAAQSYADRQLMLEPAASRAIQAPMILAPVQSQPVAASNTQRAKTSPGKSGSYSAEASGPDIVAMNADYTTQFRVVGRIPAGSTINQVSWKYGVSRKPVGFEAILCWQNEQTCWNVTQASSGSTRFFNGKDPSQPFSLYYRVKGSGTLQSPPRGDLNQIIVTYDLPD